MESHQVCFLSTLHWVIPCHFFLSRTLALGTSTLLQNFDERSTQPYPCKVHLHILLYKVIENLPNYEHLTEIHRKNDRAQLLTHAIMNVLDVIVVGIKQVLFTL